MRSLIVAGMLVAGIGASAVAQAPAGPAAGRGAPGAEMLLARTGDLGLTDAQVTRLAGIARRSAARRQSMRASQDSLRARFATGARPDSATRRQLGERMRADMQRMQEQNRVDRRDAIAVLTPDQQARAWEMIASRGRGQARDGMRPGRNMAPGMRRGPGMGANPGPRGRGEGRPARPTD